MSFAAPQVFEEEAVVAPMLSGLRPLATRVSMGGLFLASQTTAYPQTLSNHAASYQGSSIWPVVLAVAGVGLLLSVIPESEIPVFARLRQDVRSWWNYGVMPWIRRHFIAEDPRALKPIELQGESQYHDIAQSIRDDREERSNPRLYYGIMLAFLLVYNIIKSYYNEPFYFRLFGSLVIGIGCATVSKCLNSLHEHRSFWWAYNQLLIRRYSRLVDMTAEFNAHLYHQDRFVEYYLSPATNVTIKEAPVERSGTVVERPETTDEKKDRILLVIGQEMPGLYRKDLERTRVLLLGLIEAEIEEAETTQNDLTLSQAGRIEFVYKKIKTTGQAKLLELLQNLRPAWGRNGHHPENLERLLAHYEGRVYQSPDDLKPANLTELAAAQTRVEMLGLRDKDVGRDEQSISTGGSWWNNPVYTRYFAWLETVAVFAAASFLPGQYHALEPLLVALLFREGHRIGNRSALNSSTVLVLTTAHLGVGILHVALGVSHPLAFAAIAVLALVHLVVNQFASHTERRPSLLSFQIAA
jgi:hypothetical protein